MADFPPSAGHAGITTRGHSGHAWAVVATGGVLAVTAFLPWTGFTAPAGQPSAGLGSGVVYNFPGIDSASGVCTFMAGATTAALGCAELLARRRLTAFTVIPGMLAVLALVFFAIRSGGFATLMTGDPWASWHAPTLRPGWFIALVTAMAVIVFAVLPLTRRRS